MRELTADELLIVSGGDMYTITVTARREEFEWRFADLWAETWQDATAGAETGGIAGMLVGLRMGRLLGTTAGAA